ncbi:hypothetical protein GTO89_00245 [Heliobacterium gestii]|uniref:Copper amine oxidase-like N-terminal domain-containing protein n=1 Tax=Heliomicrobium gestii TaxID=2699 RepID=A0A845L784_HELGE|nr:copper amine oxidase N-terminal domain-containing protein [Heliomicrobium gestii]MBM7865193.1 hypothetical protein [Heliomicrobium gestii]MZP41461.1 hypothetical protein [Heliomicrobium gestii]
MRIIIRKTCFVAVVLSLMFSLSSEWSEAQLAAPSGRNGAEPQPVIVLNGLPMEFVPRPRIERGYVLAPLRPLAEALGADVTYDNKKRKVVIRRDNLCLEVQAPPLNQKWWPWERGNRVSGKIEDSRMLVPVYWLGRHLGDGWTWDKQTETGYLRGGSPWRDEDYLAFTRWAEILWMRVAAKDNAKLLKERGLEPPPAMRREEELQHFLGAYWSRDNVQSLWQSRYGGKEAAAVSKMGNDGIIDATAVHSWRVASRTPEEILVEGYLPGQGKYRFTGQKVTYVLRPDNRGALKIQERRVGASS